MNRLIRTAFLTLIWLSPPMTAVAAGPWDIAESRDPVATPIALHPDNHHYLLFRDHPTLLIGSTEHYGAVLNLDYDNPQAKAISHRTEHRPRPVQSRVESASLTNTGWQ